MKTSREKASQFAILGILSIAPMSGYDIRKITESSTANFWSESYGNIYPVLRSLTGLGLIRKAPQQQTPGGRPRQAYMITASGKKKLTEWIRQPTVTRPVNNEFLLKVFFGDQVSPANMASVLGEYRTTHQQLLRKYKALETEIKAQATRPEQTLYWIATLRYGQAISRALVQWTTATERALAKLPRPRA